LGRILERAKAPRADGQRTITQPEQVPNVRIEGQLLARSLMEKSRLERRVRERLEVVWLGEFEARRPHQLSRGQPERVSFARAL